MVGLLIVKVKVVFTPVFQSIVYSQHSVLMQDDSYLESYISTIGVDFVSNLSQVPLYLHAILCPPSQLLSAAFLYCC